MGRTQFLKQVLPENIENNRVAEFVLVDYSSNDGLEEWLKAEMWHHVESGKLTVYRAEGLRYFIHPHAKNLAHVLSTGDILVNMDADNMAAKDFDQWLLDIFLGHPECYARPKIGGGRIAVSRRNFMRFGGYDESMVFGWGWEDNDLADRLGRELPWVDIPAHFNWRKEHDSAIRTALTATTNLSLSNDVHRQMSVYNLDDGRLYANAGRRWGWWPKITRNYGETISLSPLGQPAGQR